MELYSNLLHKKILVSASTQYAQNFGYVTCMYFTGQMLIKNMFFKDFCQILIFFFFDSIWFYLSIYLL